jgi:hypothetical protein
MSKNNLLRRIGSRVTANGPGLTVAVVAMLVALTGGALAANGALTGTQKKEVKAIVKTEAKKFPGPMGPIGPQGLAGGQGAQGSPGIQGAKGANGESVELTAIPKEPFACEEQGGEGGVEVRLESQLEGEGEQVCNGKEGKEGQPWAPNSSLPPGATEVGGWAFNGTEADTEGIRTPISFAIPYSFNIKPAHVHFGVAEEGGAFSAGGECPGVSAFNPKAKPGELCIYANLDAGLVNATFDGAFRYTTTVPGATISGALLKFTPTGVAYGAGGFAVTGCTKTPASPGEVNECPAGS